MLHLYTNASTNVPITCWPHYPLHGWGFDQNDKWVKYPTGLDRLGEQILANNSYSWQGIIRGFDFLMYLKERQG